MPTRPAAASTFAAVLTALSLLGPLAPAGPADALPGPTPPAGAAALTRRVGVGGEPSGPPVYVPPVDAPVVDPFRPPPGPYGPGNRGLEYGTAGGEPVRAVGPGVVAFAGAVAGRLVVSVVHPDGLRSMLTGLATVSVAVGGRVVAGSLLGSAGPRLHLGVRRGRAYLDPATLFGRPVRPRRAVLVPLPGPGRRWGTAGAGR